MQTITIIGSGFAGLTAVKTIRKYNKEININLISPKAELIYLPSLIWIPSGKVKADDLRINLNNFFTSMSVNHISDEVIGIEDKTVLTKNNNNIISDAIIIASGGKFIKKLPGIESVITPCEGINAALDIKTKLAKLQKGTIAIGFASNPKEQSAMRGGPMFEFLFGIDKQLRKEKRRQNFELVFFTPADKPGARLGEKAVQSLLSEMKKHDIKTHLGHKIQGFTKDKIITQGGEIAADLILFMPGMTGNDWFDSTNLSRSAGGLLLADKFCQIKGSNNIFVAGDSGSFPGPKWMPKQAHMADLQAEAAAKNVLLALENKPVKHTFNIELICIVDSLNKGMLVKRTSDKSLVLPPSRLFHYSKRIFAWWYLRKYR